MFGLFGTACARQKKAILSLFGSIHKSVKLFCVLRSVAYANQFKLCCLHHVHYMQICSSCVVFIMCIICKSVQTVLSLLCALYANQFKLYFLYYVHYMQISSSYAVFIMCIICKLVKAQLSLLCTLCAKSVNVVLSLS